MARGRIFINYRRDDSRADAGRLYDRLAIRFPGKVFRDVASLEPGVEWHEAIARVIGQSDVCIVVIGKNWVNITDANGRRRLDDPRDTVRQEVGLALQRQIRVFPVLVGGAEMPGEEALPIDLQPLCRRNALHITEQDWDEDYSKLVRAIEIALGIRPKRSSRGESPSRTKWLWGGAGAVAALVLVATYTGNREHPWSAVNTPSPLSAGAQSVAGSKSEPNSGPMNSGVEVPRDTPASAKPRQPTPAFASGDFVGNWTALVTADGQEAEESVQMYSDNSFRVLLNGNVAAVGRWRYNAASGSLEVIDGTNFLTNGVKFGCTWAHAGGDHLTGDCADRLQNRWTVSMDRAGGNPVEIEGLPRVNVSGLSLAERAALAQVLSGMRCTCTCGLSVLECLRNDQTCKFSPNLAQAALANLLRATRT